MNMPVLESERLILRGLGRSDASALYRLINDPYIAANTLGIPYPFPYDEALPYIERNLERQATGDYYAFAIRLKPEKVFIGYIRLTIHADHHRAELAYWLGRPYWNCGYATEAALRVICFGFERLALNRIYALCFRDNPGSWRVMEKSGMTFEGLWRRDVFKDDTYRDVVFYGVLRSDYLHGR